MKASEGERSGSVCPDSLRDWGAHLRVESASEERRGCCCCCCAPSAREGALSVEEEEEREGGREGGVGRKQRGGKAAKAYAGQTQQPQGDL